VQKAGGASALRGDSRKYKYVTVYVDYFEFLGSGARGLSLNFGQRSGLLVWK
jgi:hypothetical protein